MRCVITDVLIVTAAFCFMEAIAWFAHKYIMHGLLWSLHKDHHKKESDGFFEHNDFFFLIFAIPGVVCLLIGLHQHFSSFFWIGTGVTIYGCAYFFVHDIFIHQRFKLFRKTNNAYFNGIRRAHKMHHKHLDKSDGECFGMLWVPFKFFSKKKKEDQA